MEKKCNFPPKVIENITIKGNIRQLSFQSLDNKQKLLSLTLVHLVHNVLPTHFVTTV